MIMERNYFANNLRVLRKSKGLRLKDIADKLGVSVSLVHMWEAGKREPIVNDVREIGKFFNISIADLVGTDLTTSYADSIQAETERELINCFRILTSDQQSAVITMIKGMAKV